MCCTNSYGSYTLSVVMQPKWPMQNAPYGPKICRSKDAPSNSSPHHIHVVSLIFLPSMVPALMHAPQKLIPVFPNVPWMVHFNHSYNQTTPELAQWIDLEMTCSKVDWLSEEIIFTRFSIWVRLLEQSDWKWPQPMYTMLKKLSNITLINDSKTLGAHFESFLEAQARPMWH